MTGPDDNDDLLDRAARAMAEAPPEGDFPEQDILRHVQSVLSSNGHGPRITPSSSLESPARRSIFHRFSRYKSQLRVAASLLIAATAMAALTWALFQSRPVLAFSIVADQLHNARTMSADLTVQQSNIALNGKLLFSSPSRFRLEFAGIPLQVADLKAGRVVVIDHENKSAVVMHLDAKGLTPADDPTAQSLDWIEKLRNVSQDAGKSVGEDEIDGRRAKEFDVTEEGQHFTIWADARTGAPLRVESTLQIGDKSVKFTLDRLVLDEPLEDSLFSTAVPAGYAQQQTTVSAAAPGEKDLVAFLKDYASRTGVFPPTLLDPDKALAPIVSGNSASTQPLLSADLMQTAVLAGRVMMFLNQLPPTADWHYAGRNLRPTAHAAATTPIFWYHAKSPETWRVIYADLHTAEVPAADGPRAPAESQPVNK